MSFSVQMPESLLCVSIVSADKPNLQEVAKASALASTNNIRSFPNTAFALLIILIVFYLLVILF
nr:MAG TPA: hypothetical protein [Caudoviricetes sp.]